MFIQSDNRRAILDYLFKEGVIVAEKNMGKKHPDLPVPNLEVIQLMRSYTSKQLVKQQYAWRHYYWYLTNDGINHLREVLCLAEDVVPNTLKKTSRSMQEGGPRGADEGRRFQGGRGETRTDPSDGVEKSKRDFIQLYGGFDEWDAAGGRTGGAGGGKAGENGKGYRGGGDAVPYVRVGAHPRDETVGPREGTGKGYSSGVPRVTQGPGGGVKSGGGFCNGCGAGGVLLRPSPMKIGLGPGMYCEACIAAGDRGKGPGGRGKGMGTYLGDKRDESRPFEKSY